MVMTTRRSRTPNRSSPSPDEGRSSRAQALGPARHDAPAFARLTELYAKLQTVYADSNWDGLHSNWLVPNARRALGLSPRATTFAPARDSMLRVLKTARQTILLSQESVAFVSAAVRWVEKAGAVLSRARSPGANPTRDVKAAAVISPGGFPVSPELDAAVAVFRTDAALPSTQVPLPAPQLSDADAAATRLSWDAIDHLVDVAALTRPPNMTMMEKIPRQYQESWAEALTLVYSRANDALRSGDAGLDLDRALMWASLLPELLLRAPRRGGRKGLLSVSARFRMFQERDMASLIAHWESDTLYYRRRLLTQTAPTPESVMRRCKRLIARREISKATRLLNRRGLGDLSDLAILAQMKDKHPPRQHPIPEDLLGIKGDPSVSPVDLAPAISKLRALVAPGPSGMRNEYLMCLVGGRCPDGSHVAIESLNTFCTFWACNLLPGWFNRVFASGVLVAPVKKLPAVGAVPDCRPLVIQEALRCVTERTVMQCHEDVYRAHLAPQQLAVGVPNGDGILVHGIRLLMEQLGDDAVAVHLDVRNAYNTLRRLAILRRHQQIPDLADVMPTLAAPGSETSLVVDGSVGLVSSAEGIQQGSPLSTPDFCVSIHPEVVEADAALSAKGGAVRFYADDGYLIGLPEDVWHVFRRLREALLAALDLHVHDDDKTKAYSKNMEHAQEGAPPGIEWQQMDGHYGLEVLGVPLGSEGYISRFLAAKAAEVVAHIESTVTDLLNGASRHHAWLVLPYSLQHKLVYWCRNCFPDDVVEMCARVDAALERAASQVHGVSFTSTSYLVEDYTTAAGYSYLCDEYDPDNVLHDPELGGAPPPPDPLQFSHRTVDRALSRLHLPVRLKGGGLRSSLCTTRVAFWGSVNASFRRLVDNKDAEGEVVPGFFDSQLSDCIGRGTFNETDSSATRYTHFLESSGSQYVPALREAWQHMGQQAALGNLPDEGNHLILPAESARGDQKQLTSLLETSQFVCLVREIDRLPDSQRERRTYHTLDAWSSKWLQSFPDGPVYAYTDEEWQVQAAAY